MKPMRVRAGEYAPDVDEMMEKANSMVLKLESDLRDDSGIQNVHGVEGVRPAHYWTNQDLPETNIESVSKKSPSAENVTILDANPHQTGSTLRVHENNAGGPAHPTSLSKANPIEALMGGGEPEGGPMKPMGDDDDAGDNDAESLASRIKSMVDDLADMSDGDSPEEISPEETSPEEDM